MADTAAARGDLPCCAQRFALSPCGLTWAHIFRELIAIDDAVEALKPVSYGNGPRGFVAFVTCPATEAGDGPAGPGQAVGRMGVLLLAGSPLQLLLQRAHDRDLLGIEHATGR